MTLYRPGTDEKDLKKVIMALQASATAVDTNTTDIATANTNIATNTTNIATNTASIAAINAAWVTYTPTLSSSAGTLAATGTTASATGRYQQNGKTIILQIYATITTVGTATGQLKATLPVTAKADFFPGMAKESALTGKSGAAQILAGAPTLVQAIDAAGTTFLASGGTVNFGITYEAA